MASSTSLQAPSRRWTATQVNRFKPLVFMVCLYPLLRWVFLGVTDELSANPPEFLIRSSGIWALVALCLTLLVTPLRRVLGQPALVRVRRLLGLFAFFYTSVHVLGWAWWECGVSLAAMWNDVLQRTFILLGMLAFVPMMALAVTSTQGWMRRLGRHWQTLHRLVYGIAVLSVWHFWLMRAGKNDFFEPGVYAWILAGLLGIRLAWFLLGVKARRDGKKR